jgi:hypothetical protein
MLAQRVRRPDPFRVQPALRHWAELPAWPADQPVSPANGRR